MTTPVPTDLDAIAQLQNGAVRNLLITQRYHDLSLALTETLGDANVNWSTFATWASKTAGLSIRNEEVPPFVAGLAQEHVLLLHPVRDTLGEVSSSIAEGNQRVYAELAPLFAEFVRIFRDQNGGEPQLKAFVSKLNPAETADGGQAPLIPAFTAYFQARSAPDETIRARLMLLGNCLIGLHEQTRLQPQIAEAMDAPIDEIVRKHLDGNVGVGIVARLFPALAKPAEAFLNDAQGIWEQVATRLLMSLSLPGGQTLPLGQNIPKLSARRPFLPSPLRTIVDPAQLVTLLSQYDRAAGTTDQDTASVDWCKLDDRMNFIVNLFRSRQQDLELLGQPFSAGQREAFEQRQMPAPSLGKL